MVAVAFFVVTPPTASAVDTVTYEVTSQNVGAANIEYFENSQRRVLNGVHLPWRLDVTVADVRIPSSRGAEVRADWRPYVPASILPPGMPIGYWVTVRISYRGKVICQNTLDVGNAACYGSTTFKN
jgi:hypothetical protein